MVIRRSVFALSVALFLASSPAFAQAPKEQVRKLSDDEKKELSTISKMLSAGQPAANDLGLTWVGNDLLKAQGNKQYVPFTVTLETSKVTGNQVSLYWRVVSTDPAPAAAAPEADKKDDKKDDKNKAPQYAFENLHLVNVQGGEAAPLRISRSFAVPAGNYDVYVVAKEPDPKKKGDPPAKIGMVKQSVTVPDLWNGELATSSIVLADRVDPIAAPLTPLQQEERPYAFGNMEIVPVAAGKLSKKNELSVFLLIYNTKVDAANAPDVQVEYNFYNVQGGQEKFFNKTTPQALNAQTLPPGFDPSSGITNGQTVPLASFPEGDYRLEIKITDKLANKSLTRDVKFSVAGS